MKVQRLSFTPEYYIMHRNINVGTHFIPVHLFIAIIKIHYNTSNVPRRFNNEKKSINILCNLIPHLYLYRA